MTIDFSAFGTHVKNHFDQNLFWINIQSLINYHVKCVPCAARNFSKSTNWIAIKMCMTQTRNSDVRIQDAIVSTKARVSTKHQYQSHCREYQEFEGPDCDKTFTEKKNLDQHMELHSDNLKEVCKTCRKRLQRRSSLRVHIRVKHPPLTPSSPPRLASPEY